MELRTVALAGSTGSIGRQALEVLEGEPDRWRVAFLSASRSTEELVAQAKLWRPEVVGVADKEAAAAISGALPPGVSVVVGEECAVAAASFDVVLNGVVGFAGLPYTLAALGKGKRLALANKESLIAAAPVVEKIRAAGGGEIVPVDSEHCAIHQCLRSGGRAEVARLVLTASGGPFANMSAAELAEVTVEQALAHPTWSMGPKITVDSSTLMNKGLEAIEAHALFGVPYDSIEVVVHPQSIIHSMVEFTDGATIAQLSLPDMRLPIGYALGWPDRLGRPFGAIDWARLARLDFGVPDTSVFGCLALAYEAGRAGKSAPAWLNAANEVAVEAFLAGRLGWAAIAEVVSLTLSEWDGADLVELEDVLEADAVARSKATAVLQRRGL